MLLSLVPATATCAIMQSQNQFPETNRQTLDFLHPFFDCAGSHTEQAPLLEMLYHVESAKI